MANDSGPDKDPQTLPQLQATGAEIFGSDEEKIGDLGEVRDSDFTVTGRGLLKGELNIPVSRVARITADDRVFLDVPADEAKDVSISKSSGQTDPNAAFGEDVATERGAWGLVKRKEQED
ncbi:Hypothetical Protein RradSPS_1553 [Rubrobacter radiotolerans]|uniref:PRC-barrel domain n=1 Tax=Rubrobacter radiotolerans TaxID=42256 RepID=A0A023X3R0_RUBRA|nr:hypothetical protein [Rubrobacter radiotolerans]AHY46836.1 Hypothetical Protein RradSPS_1553 [Rubrobacter radiotolerans]MDX5894242.1 hypothetical protein [Rubrobacter radiotolerans]SMC05540.1 hypothetical protein SAMN00767673_1553 [Rubrobacter radiotolerans DSM 5868]